ncbi:hypothetical protein GCM10022215_13340 [Nocardioides fonticola]|uniref:Uncharacterized protein n=1 Tax=Nocardioides fonticola TaxID=450363 RepID=A0ABP7XGT7_9ACTN
MGPHLADAFAHVLHDLEVCAAPIPRIEESDWQTWPGAESAMLGDVDGSGTGVWVDTTASAAERLAMLADQVQDWAVESVRRGTRSNWPPCPAHPANHPLQAVVVDDAAVWRCPRSAEVVAEIGHLVV